MIAFTDLLEQHGALSHEKQLALGDLIGELDWLVDMKRGTISFGEEFEFPAQVLGTEAEDAGTWLWAWANEASNIPPALLKCSETLREFGAQDSISELYTPELSLEQVQGHLLALVAVGVCEASAYYRGPYPGGAAFVLINSSQVKVSEPPDLLRMVNTFVQFIGYAPVDHKRAFTAYAQSRGFKLEDTEEGVTARTAAGQELNARFDKLGRLANLTTMIKPS
jgi:hypothetical protein